MSQENFPANEFNIFKVIKEVTINFLTGLSTLKGHAMIDEYRNMMNQEQYSGIVC